jgi:hypothetical protein
MSFWKNAENVQETGIGISTFVVEVVEIYEPLL